MDRSEQYDKEKRGVAIWFVVILTFAIAFSTGATYLLVLLAERLHGISLR